MSVSLKKLFGFGTVCVLLSMASCGGEGDRKVVEDDGSMCVVEFEEYRYDAVAAVPDSDVLDMEGGKYWRLTGNGMLPVRIGDKDISVLRDSLERLGCVLKAGGSHSAPRLDGAPFSDMGLTLTDLDPKNTKACSTTCNQLTVALCTPEVIVWRDYSYSYLCLAAHGMYNTSFVNYSISEGKILSMSDIMKPGYEAGLTALLRQKITEEKVSLLVPLEEVGIPKDFEITPQGIRFMYALYEIAPYVEGEITIDFDAYELEELLAPGVFSRYFSVTPDQNISE